MQHTVDLGSALESFCMVMKNVVPRGNCIPLYGREI
jgi:hypothetical protein